MRSRRRVALVFSKAGYETDDFVAAAERLDIELIPASDRCQRLRPYWPDTVIPVRFHEAEQSARTLADALAPLRPDGVVGIGDRAVVVASAAAARLGLAANPPEAAAASRDKLESRRRLAAAGVPVPAFAVVEPGNDPRPLVERVGGFPCVLKPRRLSGSRGVIRVDDDDALLGAQRRIDALMEELDVRRLHGELATSLLLEQFVDGPEIAVEGLLINCNLQILAVFDKPDPLNGPFFAETIYVTPSSLSDREGESVYDTIKSSCDALGLVHGPIHAELRLTPAGPVVLEVAGRSIGGLCSRTLRFGTGVSLEELILRQAAGLDVMDLERENRAAGVMMLPILREGILRTVSGVDAARSVPCIESVEITAKKGQPVRPLPEGDAYLGFIFARAARADGVIEALRTATAALRVEISPGLPVQNVS